MKFYKLIFLVFVGSILFFSCKKDTSFEIEKGRVGKISKETKMYELMSIFESDSLIVHLSEGSLSSNEDKYFHEEDEYFLYEKGGKHLLTIIPIEQHDSLSTIKSIEIFDNRYKTIKGISFSSPFRDINAAYSLSITNTISSAHIDIDELNATMTIDKKEIGIEDFNRDEIKADRIPDLANIKHFTIWFN